MLASSTGARKLISGLHCWHGCVRARRPDQAALNRPAHNTLQPVPAVLTPLASGGAASSVAHCAAASQRASAVISSRIAAVVIGQPFWCLQVDALAEMQHLSSNATLQCAQVCPARMWRPLLHQPGCRPCACLCTVAHGILWYAPLHKYTCKSAHLQQRRGVHVYAGLFVHTYSMMCITIQTGLLGGGTVHGHAPMVAGSLCLRCI